MYVVFVYHNVLYLYMYAIYTETENEIEIVTEQRSKKDRGKLEVDV